MATATSSPCTNPLQLVKTLKKNIRTLHPPLAPKSALNVIWCTPEWKPVDRVIITKKVGKGGFNEVYNF